MKRISWILCVLFFSTIAVAARQTKRNLDITTVQDRLVESVLPSEAEDMARVHELAASYAAALESDGSWSDINYADKAKSAWKTADHLRRTLVMAKSARFYRNAGKIDPALEAKTIRALRFWTDRDIQNPNWWWNQIGTPQLVGEIGCLLGPALPGDQATKIIRIMGRGDWRHGKWTGGNLTWVVTIQIARGCLQNDPAGVADSYVCLYRAIKIAGLHEEGIQPDFSFHQHGDQLYNGGYGLAYGNDVGRFISCAWGTAFQIPPAKMKLFCSYLLDGQQWMMRGDEFDYSVIGREIVRPAAGERSKWTVGPIDPAGKAYGMPHMVALLAAEATPWRKDLAALSRRLGAEGKPAAHIIAATYPSRISAGSTPRLLTIPSSAPLNPNTDTLAPLVGNKQFWCSDYMVHRRPAFFTSVKMLSNRMLNGETVNSEGKKSEHLSDGANYLYLRGDEYENIFPVWDWTKVPGTTAVQGTLAIGGRNPVGQRGRAAFAGGVSDGMRGACAMDLARGHLIANKAWFFFDDCYACLGSGITLAGDTQHAVATDVNQTLLSGSVTSSPSPGTPGEGRGEGTSAFSVHRSAFPERPHPNPLPEYRARGQNEIPTDVAESNDRDIQWVYHNHIGYIFAAGENVHFSAGNQTGRWSDIGAGPSDLVTLPVFDLWIDHGKSCHDASYQYVVLPGVSALQTEQRSQHPRLRILANDQMQAVYDPSLKLAEIVFRAPGLLATPIGRLQVNHACLLTARQTAHGVAITAANPENQPLSLVVGMDQKSIRLNLPGGDYAGSSVSAIVP